MSLSSVYFNKLLTYLVHSGYSIQLYNSRQEDTQRQLAIVSQTDTNNEPVIMTYANTAPLGVDWVYEGGKLSTYDGAQCLDVTSELWTIH